MGLAHRVLGRGRRLVLAHGFTQNARCWGPFANDLAADHEVVAVDLPGHGETEPGHDHADLVESGHLLAEVGDRAVYIGYSMGGRIALHAALDQPDKVEGLVLIGSTAGIDDAGDRRSRRRADEALADHVVSADLGDFLDRWLANPLFAGLSSRSACRAERMVNRQVGLAASLRCRGTGTQEPLWSRLAQLEIPVLVLVGEDDDRYTEIGHRLAELLPQVTLRSLPATHAVHLECPTGTADLVRGFVETHWPQ